MNGRSHNLEPSNRAASGEIRKPSSDLEHVHQVLCARLSHRPRLDGSGGDFQHRGKRIGYIEDKNPTEPRFFSKVFLFFFFSVNVIFQWV